MRSKGFTIVEIIVVVVVIGVLASIVVIAYNGVQENARLSKIKSDINQIIKAVNIARNNTGKTMGQITGSFYTAGGCANKSDGTDLAALAKTDPCWTRYLTSMANLSTASGMNLNDIVDPWGRPYEFDENEGEGGTGCGTDWIGAYAMPYIAAIYPPYPGSYVSISKSGNSGCSL
jgi:prepilin-type N-terminal cleavage/methylation domain-containing protein